MAAAPEEAPDGLGALAELGDHLEHARQVLHIPPFGHDDPTSDEGHHLSKVLAVAHTAVERFVDFVTERRLPAGGAPKIALRRLGHEVTVVVDRSAGQADIVAFIAALRMSDERLLNCAELIGLLCGLGTKWAAAAFAPPVVLTSLRKTAPRILELGKELIVDNQKQTH